ncbi:RNA helicase [Saliniradius amylolyticus]|uniref:RNA helicase n=1 Tax=Saliniradius amylolyticus TaxID=2183582 RepID=A0A2S2E5M3_9ALTE|nr:DEAD/DEAH box helicase [Saliniradius amylolyticus]AWL12267.1 RNA helicase [Saliniradius amylolyticus]
MHFSELPLDHRLTQTLERKGFEEATEIQAKGIAPALQHKDLIVSSKTGSGKTLAYLIPAIQRVLRTKALSKKDPRVLILAPTRELAKQVFSQLKSLTDGIGLKSALVLGGENFNDQVKALRKDPQFVVGTAGRIADHLKDRSLFLNGLELLILDEADRMLDLGFSEQLKAIDAAADHRKRQTLMYSATLDNAELHELTREMLNAPQRISLGAAGEEHKDIEQKFIFADHIEHKEALLNALLKQQHFQQAIIFTATREDTDRLAKLVSEQGYKSMGLSGEQTQAQRSHIMSEFSRGHFKILVTTDVASRGLDLLKVSLVVNFDLPKQAEEYVHRVGRTGRAGNQGSAYSFVGPKDWNSFVAIRDFIHQQPEFTELDGLAAKFSGFKAKPNKRTGKWAKASQKGAQGNNGKTKQKKPVKRINTFAGEDVGDKPLLIKKKPRPKPEEE